MPKIFVSDAIHQERLMFDASRLPVGRGLRGWKALSALYQDSFAACRYRIRHVVRPEIYQTDLARKILGVEAGDWHLAVKPIEHLRPFHGIPNVFVCDWPFPEISAKLLDGSPFFNHVHLLKMADAVLCCTEFTANTLRNAGIDRVVTLPPVIPVSRRKRPTPSRSGAPCRFLSVVDSDHLVRQLGPTIEGFAQAATQRGDLRLVVHLLGGGEQAVADLRERATQISAAMSLDLMVSIVAEGIESDLQADADFYLCADAAPGLNLPLATAMSAGMPVVTTMTAGTGSFLSPDAAVPVATRSEALGGDEEPVGRFLSLTSNPPTAEAVCDAVLAAATLDEASLARMAVASHHIAEQHFGLTAFKAGLEKLGAFVPLGAR